MFPTGLSMLWESTDPQRALQTRFGLDSFDDAVGWLTKGLAQAFAVDVEACDRILISDNNAIAWVRTDQEMLVAKWSCDQNQFVTLSAIADLLQALNRQGCRWRRHWRRSTPSIEQSLTPNRRHCR